MTTAADQAYAYDAARLRSLKQSYTPGGPLPRAFYLSPEVLNADLDLIWRRHWLYAGHACEIPEAGDWMTWRLGHDSVVLVRGGDGAVRAFHNVCRHRGARLCTAESGNSRLLVCPYHAWTYELGGALRVATQKEFGRHQSQLGLLPVALRNLGDLLFVALGPEPLAFDAAAAEIAPAMASYGFAEAKVAKRIRWRVEANWKLVFENNRECYHCPTAHPEYVAGTYDTARFDAKRLPEVERETAAANARFAALGLGSAAAASTMTGAYWRVTRAPLMAGWHTESLDGAPVAPLMGRLREQGTWSRGTLRATLFPNFWQHANDDHAVATRLTPIDATTTEVDVTWLVHRDAVEGRDYTLARLLPFWQRTSEQDWAICAAQQAGVASPAYVPGLYSRTRETNVQHFVDWYLGALALAIGEATPGPTAAEKPKPAWRSLGFKDRPGGLPGKARG